MHLTDLQSSQAKKSTSHLVRGQGQDSGTRSLELPSSVLHPPPPPLPLPSPHPLPGTGHINCHIQGWRVHIRIRHSPFFWGVEMDTSGLSQGRHSLQPGSQDRTVVIMMHTIACASPFLMGLHGQARHHEITAIHWTSTSGRTLAVLASLGDSPGGAALGCIAAVGPLPAALLGSWDTHGQTELYRGSWPRKESQLHDICWPGSRGCCDLIQIGELDRFILECPDIQDADITFNATPSHSPSPISLPWTSQFSLISSPSQIQEPPRLLNLARWLFLGSHRHPAGTP